MNKTFTEALDGALERVRHTLLDKQSDYGPDNIAEFGLTGVVIRANDKMARLKHLLRGEDVPRCEPVEDSLLDLVGYGIIGLLLHRGEWGLPMGAEEQPGPRAPTETHEMSEEQWSVLAFHERFGCATGEAPRLVDWATARLRLSLIQDELDELVVAEGENNLPNIADAIGDLLYVVYGAAVAHGINMRPIFREIHQANMRKVGGATRADGKILKPEGWLGPEPGIAQELLEQRRGGGWGPPSYRTVPCTIRRGESE